MRGQEMTVACLVIELLQAYYGVIDGDVRVRENQDGCVLPGRLEQGQRSQRARLAGSRGTYQPGHLTCQSLLNRQPLIAVRGKGANLFEDLFPSLNTRQETKGLCGKEKFSLVHAFQVFYALAQSLEVTTYGGVVKKSMTR